MRKKRKLLKESEAVGSNNHYFKDITTKHGFRTYSDYLEYVAKQLGFNSYQAYLHHWRKKKKGALTQSQYIQQLARRKGVKTVGEYQRLLKKERAKSPRYKALAEALAIGLEENRISVVELSKKTGVSKQMIYEYLKGHFYPKPKRLKKLADALKQYHLILPPRTVLLRS